MHACVRLCLRRYALQQYHTYVVRRRARRPCRAPPPTARRRRAAHRRVCPRVLTRHRRATTMLMVSVSSFAQVTVSRGMDEVKTLEKRFSEVRARRAPAAVPPVHGADR